MVDNAINRSIQRVLDDMGDLSLLRFSYKFTSSAMVYQYALPLGNVAQGTLTLTGPATPPAGVLFTVTIGGTVITYTSLTSDASLPQLLASLTTKINASTVVTSGTVIVPVSPAGNAANQLSVTAAVQGVAGNAVTLTSTSSSGTLVLTASGATLTGGTAASPLVRMVHRVRYNPQGLPYNRDMIPGAKLIAYDTYQRITGAGYLQPYSFGTEPQYCTISPSRQFINFFPGPNTTGDIITVEYAPLLTAGTNAAPLVNETDVPFGVMEDWYDAIVYGACMWLWPVAREMGARDDYRKMYMEEIARR
jgi:hypothetical protein